MDDNEIRREINRLYWGSDASVGEIADRLGVSRRALYDGIEPQPAHAACPDCGGAMGFRNRTAAANREASCPDCAREARIPAGAAAEAGGEEMPEDPEVERQARGAARAPLPPRSVAGAQSGALLGGALLAGLAAGAAIGYMARRV